MPGCTGDPYRGCLCQGSMVDLCVNFQCGVNAVCRLDNEKQPQCHCPDDFPIGDPFIRCRLFSNFFML